MPFIDISGTPAEEQCAQVGTDHRASEWSRQEAVAYRAAMIALCGPPPKGYAINVQPHHHDFGTYYTVRLLTPETGRSEDYEARFASGLRYWHEVVMSPPIDYRDPKHPKPRHPTHSATESIIGAIVSTRPDPNERFPAPTFEKIHNRLSNAYPDLAALARQRIRTAHSTCEDRTLH